MPDNLFKPMLAFQKTPDFKTLKFPLIVSPKLDGIRATIQNGTVYSRSLKPLPNKFVQEAFRDLPEGLDGELIVGEPNQDPYRRTVSVVMSDDKALDWDNGRPTRLYVFDKFGPDPFHTRLTAAAFDALTGKNQLSGVRLVTHKLVETVEELTVFETECLEAGFEGAIARSPNGPYKQGRSTLAEGYLLKIKRFLDAEARIIGFYEEMENQNVATTNELGRTHRSTHQAGKVGKGTLGGFDVEGVGGIYDGIKFSLGGGFTAAQRADYWQRRDELIGKLTVYKYFPTGADTRPRIPIFKGFRDVRDM